MTIKHAPNASTPAAQEAVRESALKVENLRFSYEGDLNKLQLHIDEWRVPANKTVFLHGDSGSGKSTLLHLLAGLTLPDEGSICVDGTVISALSTRKRDQFRAKHIGIVYQQFNLIPYLSALDNVLMASVLSKNLNGNTKQRAQTLLHTMNISAADSRRAAENLSIGQQQRVAIARAMINKPALLLVDEPTSALDAKNRDRFVSLLCETLNQDGGTLIFVSHDQTLASHFDQAVSLSDINQATKIP